MTTSIKASVKAYEAWLEAALGGDLVETDLRDKHKKMRDGAFPFLRATYWRWAETILEICPDLATAPPVLAIGDTHVENFGCWRDAEGRLVWGANDFDDAAVMPYPLDLVRLAASALLARKGGALDFRQVCNSILAGYVAGLADPRPFILERAHGWLREAVMLSEQERAAYWPKYDKPDDPSIQPRYLRLLREAMPDPTAAFAAFPRSAGLGSLGRPRFVARTAWRGGPVLREAKAVVVSAWVLRHGGDATVRIADIAGGRFRAPDPHYRVADGVVVRRLSPSSRKIEAKDSKDRALLLSLDMLTAMGREIAACHAGDRDRAPALGEHLRSLTPGWLQDHARVAASQVEADQAAFSKE
uniref:DUF2252 domain-containing protein n=1 Tax=Caulobacter sp. (strain K31) TaxID=366602 RepID=B0T7A7_CAUSK